MDASKHTVRGQSLHTYRRARTTLVCVVVFWLWLLLGAAAFVAGMFDSPTKLFLAMYAGAVAVLVSIPVGLLAAVFMLLNRPAAGSRRPVAERLSAAARTAGSAVAGLPWAAAAGHAKELGSKLGPAAGRQRPESGPVAASSSSTGRPMGPRRPPLPARRPSASPAIEPAGRDVEDLAS